MPGAKNGERPYLAVPEAGFLGPIFGLISGLFCSRRGVVVQFVASPNILTTRPPSYRAYVFAAHHPHSLLSTPPYVLFNSHSIPTSIHLPPINN